MPTGSPIPLGTAAQAVLVPDAGSQITTNDFGVDVGTIRHSLGDQAQAQGKRPPPGYPYAGTLPQFRGFYVDRTAITGGEAKTCVVNMTMKAINPQWGVQPPEKSHDLEIRDITDLGITFQGIPIPHPVITYRFASAKATDMLGKFSQNLRNAPEIGAYRFPLGALNPSTGAQAVYALSFVPSPRGWICLKDDNSPCCGGRFFEIEQQWKLYYWYAGVALA
jgi:hypothetical protein